MTSPATVSVVIPAYNEEDTITRCLVALIEQTAPAEEIIVVDNRSTDRTREIVEGLITAFPDAGIRLISQNDEQGITPTRNAGFDAATGELIGRIDSDSVVQADWVEHLRAAFAEADVAAVSGPVDYYDMPLRSFGLHADDTVRKVTVKLAGKYVFLFGSNMALRADAWAVVRDAVCPDRADLMHEDLDLSVHLALAGLKVGYAPGMVAGISARRLDTSPRDFHFYVDRFERTYRAHGIHDPGALAPMAVLLGIYPILHVQRGVEHRIEERRHATAD
jgi:glycosyltransferase involved in cell wall biosynthesis